MTEAFLAEFSKRGSGGGGGGDGKKERKGSAGGRKSRGEQKREGEGGAAAAAALAKPAPPPKTFILKLDNGSQVSVGMQLGLCVALGWQCSSDVSQQQPDHHRRPWEGSLRVRPA